jgi:hypothetical protein
MLTSLSCNNDFNQFLVEIQKEVLSNIPVEDLPRYACVCRLWSEFVRTHQRESLCKIIAAFPQEILDAFGGVEKIADFPAIPKIEGHRIYYSQNVSPCKMIFPVMRGIDEIGQLFISIIVNVGSRCKALLKGNSKSLTNQFQMLFFNAYSKQ